MSEIKIQENRLSKTYFIVPFTKKKKTTFDSFPKYENVYIHHFFV